MFFKWSVCSYLPNRINYSLSPERRKEGRKEGRKERKKEGKGSRGKGRVGRKEDRNSISHLRAKHVIPVFPALKEY